MLCGESGLSLWLGIQAGNSRVASCVCATKTSIFCTWYLHQTTTRVAAFFGESTTLFLWKYPNLHAVTPPPYPPPPVGCLPVNSYDNRNCDWSAPPRSSSHKVSLTILGTIGKANTAGAAGQSARYWDVQLAPCVLHCPPWWMKQTLGTHLLQHIPPAHQWVEIDYPFVLNGC